MKQTRPFGEFYKEPGDHESPEAEVAHLRHLLNLSLSYLRDPALLRDDTSGRRRRETKDAYEDRISANSEFNLELQNLVDEIECALGRGRGVEG